MIERVIRRKAASTRSSIPMYLPLGTHSPEVRLGFVSASRNCFPRTLAEERSNAMVAAAAGLGDSLVVPEGACAVIETRSKISDMSMAVRQFSSARASASAVEELSWMLSLNG